MLNFQKVIRWAGLPAGACCIILATVLALRSLGGDSSWTSSAATDTVVGFLLFAVGATTMWLSTRRPTGVTATTKVRSGDDATSEEGMKRLREAFGSPWPGGAHEESSTQTSGRSSARGSL